ncbi:MAG: hypothetical protein ACI36T_04570 [Eggerthellaceae bacterium]
MPTNKECSDVAARLRVLADENTVTATPNFNHVLFAALGGEPPAAPSTPTLNDLKAYDWALLYRLADLIEPEERTCTFSECWDDDPLPMCSACGWEAEETDCVTVIGGPLFEYDGKFCKECGAKVVE